ncbi:DUF3276 family protein [Candidatus Azobacteroides pseudotrichonymphae]|jgi:hypothetical protein|uniref:DNA-binding protein n=1 Tax=Azobacteroides pseudotrichonymphae genomovar. CFP2 TaxID=511995 RepID=B6YQU7_AZOPC|nr:DUF3276 family protein [Candidatus Azobacteroides pseudotrichonymphae]BAG83569.1 conserved hypothetical protein [Candidatus Azobacteroides pseudotrichonymphae genomovar. CFP2]
MENIVFSKVIPAGKRIYYLDVRQTRRGDMFLTLTESKKIIENSESNVFRFEKQKLFLYQEDFNKFMEGLDETISFIRKKERDKYTSSL